MGDHRTGTRAEWLVARRELLEAEKQLTRLSDELARRRQQLPWVPLEKGYAFQTEDGPRTLPELFDGRSQLMVYHFMFNPAIPGEACPSCSAVADHLDGPMVHLNHHDVTLMCVSRAPLAKLAAYRRRMGWKFPWASSLGSDFNYDFGVSFTEGQQAGGAEYNFRWLEQPFVELPGLSVFALEAGVVYHTYSAYARGLDVLWGMYQLLDRAPRGRNEGEVPADWIRRHDQYDDVTVEARL
jgi:predicted dithiol-disulfide oxidoreductase (DUF899 family)